MPSGKTHIKINWIILLILNILILAFSQDIQIKHYIIFNIVFVLTSYFISPDLDLNSSVYKRWGFMKWVWYPYREIMKHRGASHSLIWGPLSLMVMLVPFCIPIVAVYGGIYGIWQDVIVITIMCVFTITEIHIIADKIT